jgi:uncharacterized damage-inducible protein DinB
VLTDYVASVVVRDLNAVRREIAAYPDEASIWKLPPGIANSGGTLALHLAGNVQHFFGRILGGSDYVRDRAAEFSRRDVPRAEMLAQLDAAVTAAERGLAEVSESALGRDYPEPIGKHRLAIGDALVYLAGHLTYHLGQIDYHRRLVTGRGDTVGTIAVAESRTARPVSAA